MVKSEKVWCPFGKLEMIACTAGISFCHGRDGGDLNRGFCKSILYEKALCIYTLLPCVSTARDVKFETGKPKP